MSRLFRCCICGFGVGQTGVAICGGWAREGGQGPFAQVAESECGRGVLAAIWGDCAHGQAGLSDYDGRGWGTLESLMEGLGVSRLGLMWLGISGDLGPPKKECP